MGGERGRSGGVGGSLGAGGVTGEVWCGVGGVTGQREVLRGRREVWEVLLLSPPPLLARLRQLLLLPTAGEQLGEKVTH